MSIISKLKGNNNMIFNPNEDHRKILNDNSTE